MLNIDGRSDLVFLLQFPRRLGRHLPAASWRRVAGPCLLSPGWRQLLCHGILSHHQPATSPAIPRHHARRLAQAFSLRRSSRLRLGRRPLAVFRVKPQPAKRDGRHPAPTHQAASPVPQGKCQRQGQERSQQRKPPPQRACKVLAAFSVVNRQVLHKRPQSQALHALIMAHLERLLHATRLLTLDCASRGSGERLAGARRQ